VADWKVPLSDLSYGPAEQAAVERVLASRWISTGPEVAALERDFAAACDVEHAVAVSSATAALHLAFLALRLGPGDEVVQPALNFVATANMTRAVGATPVFADIAALESPVITRDTVQPLLTSQTKAVVVMHYGGVPALSAELRQLCAERDLALIEDAAHAVGTVYGTDAGPDLAGRRVGGGADIGCFSFFSNKNLATGEGGMLTTNDPAVAEHARKQRSHGMTTMSWDRYSGHATRYDVPESGYNYRLDDLRAALGRTQLSALQDNNAARRAHQHRYLQALAVLDGWATPFGDDRPTAAHLMVVIAPSAEIRDRAVQSLHNAGIQTSLHYPSITSFGAFGDVVASVPRTVEFAERAITLPLYPAMPADVPEQVVRILQQL
jgi:dTDP-4-amino-4,6-dideoxygalactose transaminase